MVFVLYGKLILLSVHGSALSVQLRGCGLTGVRRGAHCICSAGMRCAGVNCLAGHVRSRKRRPTNRGSVVVIQEYSLMKCQDCRCVPVELPPLTVVSPPLASGRKLHFVTAVTDPTMVAPLARSVELYGGQKLLVFELDNEDDDKVAAGTWKGTVARHQIRELAGDVGDNELEWHRQPTKRDYRHWVKGEIRLTSVIPLAMTYIIGHCTRSPSLPRLIVAHDCTLLSSAPVASFVDITVLQWLPVQQMAQLQTKAKAHHGVTIANTDYVLFLDGYDTLVQHPAQYIVDRFEHWGIEHGVANLTDFPLFNGGGIGCFPFIQWHKKWHSHFEVNIEGQKFTGKDACAGFKARFGGKSYSLNAGMYMGTAAAVTEFNQLVWSLRDIRHFTDQSTYILAAHLRQKSVYVDTNGTLLQWAKIRDIELGRALCDKSVALPFGPEAALHFTAAVKLREKCWRRFGVGTPFGNLSLLD